jgi:hypothetical protein
MAAFLVGGYPITGCIAYFCKNFHVFFFLPHFPEVIFAFVIVEKHDDVYFSVNVFFMAELTRDSF